MGNGLRIVENQILKGAPFQTGQDIPFESCFRVDDDLLSLVQLQGIRLALKYAHPTTQTDCGINIRQLLWFSVRVTNGGRADRINRTGGGTFHTTGAFLGVNGSNET